MIPRFLFALGFAALLGQQTRGDFQAYGPTTTSCGRFTASTSDSRQLLEFWFYGFVSGAGYARVDDGKTLNTDTEGIVQWVAKYCSDHPLDPLPKAAVELVNELESRK